MSLIQLLLLKVPTTLLGLFLVIGMVSLSILGLFVIRMFIPSHKIKLHNDVAGFIFATLGVIYAVLLAFVVIVAWQNFDRATTNVASEANRIEDLYRDSRGLSQDFSNKVVPVLEEYAGAIVNDEWPLMQKGERSQKVQDISGKLWNLYYSFQPKTETQKIFLSESVRKLNEAAEYRRARILDSQTGIHPVLWFVLIIGGIITILFTMFFGTENFGAQIIMSSLLSALIGLILFTVMIMDFPFTGDVSIGTDIFRQVLIHFKL